jgi:phospholipid transport system substrate-binding protein
MISTSSTTSSRIARAVALALLLAADPGAADAEAKGAASSARSVVDATIAEVLEVLASTELDTEQRRTRIEGIALARFDFPTISRLVLARNWKTKFDERQRAEFVEEFKDYLSRTYGNRIERYDQQAVDVLGERVETRGDVTVRTVIRGGEADGIAVDYRLRAHDGEWLVIDVVIEGVSLISSFRSQFQEVISQKGAEGLLEELRGKTPSDEPETTLTEDPQPAATAEDGPSA